VDRTGTPGSKVQSREFLEWDFLFSNSSFIYCYFFEYLRWKVPTPFSAHLSPLSPQFERFSFHSSVYMYTDQLLPARRGSCLISTLWRGSEAMKFKAEVEERPREQTWIPLKNRMEYSSMLQLPLPCPFLKPFYNIRFWKSFLRVAFSHFLSINIISIKAFL